MGASISPIDYLDNPPKGNTGLPPSIQSYYLYSSPISCSVNADGSITLNLCSITAFEAFSGDPKVLYHEETSTDSVTSAAGLITAGNWYHIALVCGATTRVYLNGIEVCSLPSAVSPIISFGYPAYACNIYGSDGVTVIGHGSSVGNTYASGASLGGRLSQSHTNLNTAITDHYIGYVHSFRITNSERYSANFSNFSPIDSIGFYIDSSTVISPNEVITVTFPSLNKSISLTYSALVSYTLLRSTSLITEQPYAELGVPGTPAAIVSLVTTNVPIGTLIPYTITGTGITDTDITSPMTGNYLVGRNMGGTGLGGHIGSNQDTLYISASNDYIIEGTETFTVSLNNIGESIAVGIIDTPDTTPAL